MSESSLFLSFWLKSLKFKWCSKVSEGLYDELSRDTDLVISMQWAGWLKRRHFNKSLSFNRVEGLCSPLVFISESVPFFLAVLVRITAPGDCGLISADTVADAETSELPVQELSLFLQALLFEANAKKTGVDSWWGNVQSYTWLRLRYDFFNRYSRGCFRVNW